MVTNSDGDLGFAVPSTGNSIVTGSFPNVVFTVYTSYTAEELTAMCDTKATGGTGYGISKLTVTGTLSGGPTVYSAGPAFPSSITTGPNGALWFTYGVDAGQEGIGRITTSGVVSTYTDPSIDQPAEITSGPDRALWFINTGNNSIGRITTSGVVSNYTGDSIDAGTSPPDRTERCGSRTGAIPSGRITTSGVVSTYTDPSIDDPSGITAGPDGALWFTNAGNNSIGRITTSGVVSTYTDPSIDLPEAIAAGPDGALWFVNDGTACSVSGGSIGRITTAGVVSNYPDAFPDLYDNCEYPEVSITPGPGQSLLFSYVNLGGIGFGYLDGGVGIITTSGSATDFALPSVMAYGPNAVTTGPDGAIWFTTLTNGIVRLSP